MQYALDGGSGDATCGELAAYAVGTDFVELVDGTVDTTSGGFVVHLKGFLPVAEEQVKLELPKFTESLRDNRANYAFREWLGREVERSGVMGKKSLAAGE